MFFCLILCGLLLVFASSKIGSAVFDRRAKFFKENRCLLAIILSGCSCICLWIFLIQISNGLLQHLTDIWTLEAFFWSGISSCIFLSLEDSGSLKARFRLYERIFFLEILRITLAVAQWRQLPLMRNKDISFLMGKGWLWRKSAITNLILFACFFVFQTR